MRKSIRAGWLVDGSGAPIRENIVLQVEGETIQAVETYTDDAIRWGSEVVDLSGCTLLPPFVDSHVHLAMSGSVDPDTRKQQLSADYEQLRNPIGAHLHYLFSHGVLAVRDGGDRIGAAHRFLLEEGGHPQMTLKVSGIGYHRKNRYGRLVAHDVEESADLVDAWETTAHRTPWVKLVNSGLNSLVDFGHETAPQFTVSEISSLVAAARMQGAKVMVHANGQDGVRVALDGGCHSIEHGYFMGRKNLDLMAENGAVWVPTLAPMKCFLTNMRYVTAPADRKVVERTLENQLEQISIARECGVKVALGTDSGGLGVLHGESLVEELKLYIRAGYSFSEAVHCATSVGAELLGLEKCTLAKGGRATFLVARGAPSQLPRKLSYLEGIYVDGQASAHYRKNPIKHVN